jgi:predicted metalloprotease with PDZ domain
MSIATIRNIQSRTVRLIGFLFFALLPCLTHAQARITYQLQYKSPGDCCVQVQMHFTGGINNTPIALVMPRTYPGGYEQVLYDSFVDKVRAFDASGKTLEVKHAADGPRWNVGQASESVERIEYEIDIARMESTILSSVETSKVRRAYVGLLGYSIFAYVDGREGKPIKLVVDAPENWPVLRRLHLKYRLN